MDKKLFELEGCTMNPGVSGYLDDKERGDKKLKV